jgi:20S proteasome subunit alpha 5
LGSTAIGIVTKEGVILLTERRATSKLLKTDSIEKLYTIDKNIACAVSGLIADSKFIVEHARNESQTHWFNYNESISLYSLIGSICELSLRFGEDGNEDSVIMSRPFGVALLVAGIDHSGFGLYYADPSGTYSNYLAKAIGSGSDVAQTSLDEKWHPELTLNEGLVMSLGIMKNIMEEKMSPDTVQICLVDFNGVKFLSSQEVGLVIEKL